MIKFINSSKFKLYLVVCLVSIYIGIFSEFINNWVKGFLFIMMIIIATIIDEFVINKKEEYGIVEGEEDILINNGDKLKIKVINYNIKSLETKLEILEEEEQTQLNNILDEFITVESKILFISTIIGSFILGIIYTTFIKAIIITLLTMFILSIILKKITDSKLYEEYKYINDKYEQSKKQLRVLLVKNYTQSKNIYLHNDLQIIFNKAVINKIEITHNPYPTEESV